MVGRQARIVNDESAASEHRIKWSPSRWWFSLLSPALLFLGLHLIGNCPVPLYCCCRQPVAALGPIFILSVSTEKLCLYYKRPQNMDIGSICAVEQEIIASDISAMIITRTNSFVILILGY